MNLPILWVLFLMGGSGHEAPMKWDMFLEEHQCRTAIEMESTKAAQKGWVWECVPYQPLEAGGIEE